jgi:hypothetical protein
MGLAITAAAAALAPHGAGAATTVLHYGFDATSGSVNSNGGFVTDRSGLGNNGTWLTGDGGTYSDDIPAASLRQFTTGIGSLDTSTGAVSTDPAGLTSGAGLFLPNGNKLSHDDIATAGGLTLEAWSKGGTSPGGGGRLILSIYGAYNLRMTSEGVVFDNGFTAPSDALAAGVDTSQWRHYAGVLSNAVLDGTNLTADLAIYVDGTLAGAVTGSVFAGDLSRGAVIGDHPLANSLGIKEPFDGLVYEPRITLGALSPEEFTVVPEPSSLAVLALACLPALRRRRRD